MNGCSQDEYGLCRHCGGHGRVMEGTRVNERGRAVPLMIVCSWCDGRDRVTPLIEAQVPDGR